MYSISANSQNVNIDFTRESYLKKLDFPEKSIVSIRRKYFEEDNLNTSISKKLDTSFNFSIPISVLNLVNFSLASFKNETDFSDITFKKNVDFSATKFEKFVTFSNSFFSKDLDCSFTIFCSNSDFYSAHILSQADFTDAYFTGVSTFENAQFHTNVVFSGSTFRSIANFKNVELQSSTNFDEVHFDSVVSFEAANFSGIINFQNSIFKTKLNLRNLTTTRNTMFDFSYCVLPDTIDISNNKAPNLMFNFTSANFTSRLNTAIDKYDKHHINICNINSEKFKIDYSHFVLYFPDNLSYNEKIAIYEGLRQNFIKNHQVEDLSLLDIEYNKVKWGHQNIAQKFLIVFSDPLNVLFFTIAFWLFFTAVNYFFVIKLNGEVFTITSFEQDYPYLRNRNAIRTCALKLFYSLIYTSIIYFSFRLDLGKFRFYNRPLLLWFGLIYSIGCINLFLLAHLLFKN